MTLVPAAMKHLDWLRQAAPERLSSPPTDALDQDLLLRRAGLAALVSPAAAYVSSLRKRKSFALVDSDHKLLPLEALASAATSHAARFDQHSASFPAALALFGSAHSNIALDAEQYASHVGASFLASIEDSVEHIDQYAAQRRNVESKRSHYESLHLKSQKTKTEDPKLDHQVKHAREAYESADEELRRLGAAIQAEEADHYQALTDFLDHELDFVRKYHKHLSDIQSKWPSRPNQVSETKAESRDALSQSQSKFASDISGLIAKHRKHLPGSGFSSARPSRSQSPPAPTTGQKQDDASTSNASLDETLEHPKPVRSPRSPLPSDSPRLGGGSPSPQPREKEKGSMVGGMMSNISTSTSGAMLSIRDATRRRSNTVDSSYPGGGKATKDNSAVKSEASSSQGTNTGASSPGSGAPVKGRTRASTVTLPRIGSFRKLTSGGPVRREYDQLLPGNDGSESAAMDSTVPERRPRSPSGHPAVVLERASEEINERDDIYNEMSTSTATRSSFDGLVHGRPSYDSSTDEDDGTVGLVSGEPGGKKPSAYFSRSAALVSRATTGSVPALSRPNAPTPDHQQQQEEQQNRQEESQESQPQQPQSQQSRRRAPPPVPSRRRNADNNNATSPFEDPTE